MCRSFGGGQAMASLIYLKNQDHMETSSLSKRKEKKREEKSLSLAPILPCLFSFI